MVLECAIYLQIFCKLPSTVYIYICALPNYLVLMGCFNGQALDLFHGFYLTSTVEHQLCPRANAAHWTQESVRLSQGSHNVVL